jgi:hypothetical protein
MGEGEDIIQYNYNYAAVTDHSRVPKSMASLSLVPSPSLIFIHTAVAVSTQQNGGMGKICLAASHIFIIFCWKII